MRVDSVEQYKSYRVWMRRVRHIAWLALTVLSRFPALLPDRNLREKNKIYFLHKQKELNVILDVIVLTEDLKDFWFNLGHFPHKCETFLTGKSACTYMEVLLHLFLFVLHIAYIKMSVFVY